MQRLFPFDQKSLKGQCDDENIEWAWPDADKAKWEAVTNGYQKFYEHWRNNENSTGSNFLDTFPYKLSLGSRPGGAPLLPFRPSGPSGDQILVTKSYENMFRRLLRLRNKDLGAARGAVLTGQPGIGKTVFLKFMLTRLVSLRQVVLLYDSYHAYLFYRGQVYFRSTGSSFADLPTCKQARYCPIWALIDVDYRNGAPPLMDSSCFWPIQASSPYPVQWKSWRKQNGAALLGMPLWDMEELMEGLCLYPGYNEIRSKLEKSLPLPDGLTLPTTHDEAFNAMLKVLQTEREMEKVAGAEEEGRGGMGDCTGALAADQDQPTADVAGQPPASAGEVDNALKILVRNATEEFGFAPRDVYGGVFRLPRTRAEHPAAVRRLSCSKLMTIIETFVCYHELDDSSHQVVVVYPLKCFDGYDHWGMDFKSIRIAEEVMGWMGSEEDKHLWEMYGFLRKFSEGSALAGWIFEVIIHRMLSGRQQSEGPTLQPIPMVSDDRNPPTFSTDSSPLSSSTPDTSLSSLMPLRADTRRIVMPGNLIHGLSNVTLDNDRYYVPATTNNPLFDSFTIDFDLDRHTAVISVFHITISSRHGGSAEGYPLVRKIVARVRELLKDEGLNATVKVGYFLVCPDDGSKHEWQMPVDRGKSVKCNGHHGHAFCIRVPVLVPLRLR